MVQRLSNNKKKDVERPAQRQRLKNLVKNRGAKSIEQSRGEGLILIFRGGRVASLTSLPTPPHLPMCDGFLLGYADNLIN